MLYSFFYSPQIFTNVRKQIYSLEQEPHILKTTNQYQTIENLNKFTNYTIRVLAFTKVGDGTKTKPFFCTTFEDVPSAPADIKAIPASSNKVIVSWLPPKYRNGEIVSFKKILVLIT